jgi:hypothetical protein
MITPSYGLTATERVLPNMALDFTTATLDPRVTFTRTGNTATVINSSGVIVGINADLPRFDYDPITLACNGLLIEEARTNLLLNSTINGVSLATQLVTTTAVAHTLSFYGTGTIVLTGTSSATVAGTGAYPSRRTLTFTPTAGVLTLTVTGTVQFAQLEIGAFATSYIPTAASQVTRTADVATMNDMSWLTAGEGSLYSRSSVYATNIKTQGVWQLYGGTTTTSLRSPQVTTPRLRALVGGAFTGAGTGASITPNTFIQAMVAWDGLSGQLQSSAVGENVTAVATLDATEMSIGSLSASTQLNGHVSKIMYWPYKLTTAELQAFST